MKPFKHIKEVSDIINDLKFELQHSKNKVRDAKRINSLIDCVNAFEIILEDKYKTDQIDNLLAYIFREELLKHEASGNKIDFRLNNLINKIDLHLRYNSNQNIKLLANEIKLYEFSKNILNLEIEKAKQVPEEKTITKQIKDLFLQFKTYMLWIK